MEFHYKLIFIVLFVINIAVSEYTRESLFRNGPCRIHDYRCLNDRCISRSQHCNGRNDCGDNSDEVYCSTSSSCPNNYKYHRCPLHYSHVKCIPEAWKCDGINDCSNDETNCARISDSSQVTSFQITRSVDKAKKWIMNQRKPERSINRWGTDLARKAVALYMYNNTIFKQNNSFTDEIVYELSLSLLSQLALKKIEDVSTSELASYVNAFLVTCINPRKFYVLDLVKEVRKRLDSSNSTNPFALLSLCNAKEVITDADVQKLLDVFNKAQLEHKTGVQAITVLALACAATQSPNIVQMENIIDLTLELKKKQHRNGTIENIKTTALTLQAIFATQPEPDEEDFDERKAIYQIIRSQESGGSFGNLANTYYSLPVLNYLSLINISSSHCSEYYRDEEESFQHLKNLVGEKWTIKYSLWIGDNSVLKRSIILSVPTNTSLYGIMEYAAELDEKYRFDYIMRSRKPYVFSLSGIMDDPETEMFWNLYYLTDDEKNKLKPITKSPAEVIPENNDHLVFWYKTTT